MTSQHPYIYGPVTPEKADTFASSEDGSVTTFALFVFLMILMFAGMAVDLMRFETRRTALQHTLDAATLSAARLTSDADAEALVRDFMEKRGYDSSLTQVDVREVRSGGDGTDGSGSVVSRKVSATHDLDVNTIFMPLLGIENLGTTSVGAAQEGVSTVEVSLVLDISNSMNAKSGVLSKVQQLQKAAKQFTTQMIDQSRTDNPVTLSIVPYNHVVVLPEAIMNEIDAPTDVITIPPPDREPWPGHLKQYPYAAEKSRCIKFTEDMMTTTNLDQDAHLLRQLDLSRQFERLGYYAMHWPEGINQPAGPGRYARPDDIDQRTCGPEASPILPFETDVAKMHTYIDAMTARGATAIDMGIKWGLALLDPNFREITDVMLTNGDVSAAATGRPYDYDPSTFMKVLVVMTDGENDIQWDLRDEYKRGPSPVWYSEKAANETGPNNEDWSSLHVVDNQIGSGEGATQGSDGIKDRAKEWYDGYYVQQTDAAGNRRWMRPHAPDNFTDGVLLGQSALPFDARQLDMVELHDRFSRFAIADIVSDDTVGDSAMMTRFRYITQDGFTKREDGDRRMLGASDGSLHGLCDAAKVDNDVLIYTITFQSTEHSQNVMRQCATSDSYHFNAPDAATLEEAFASIATSIKQLRLVQ